MRSVLFFIVISIVWSGCTPRVIQFVNDESNFEQYGTYLILNFKVSDEDLSEEGRNMISEIERQIHANLTERGYQSVEQKPDMLLRYDLLANNNSRTNVDNNPYSPFVTVSTRTFREASLLFELTDRKTRKLIWQGSLDLKQQHRPKKKQDELSRAIELIFDSYPYQALSKVPIEN